MISERENAGAMKPDSESITRQVQAVLYCCATNGCRETFWTLADVNIHTKETSHWNLVLRELKKCIVGDTRKSDATERSRLASRQDPRRRKFFPQTTRDALTAGRSSCCRKKIIQQRGQRKMPTPELSGRLILFYVSVFAGGPNSSHCWRRRSFSFSKYVLAGRVVGSELKYQHGAQSLTRPLSLADRTDSCSATRFDDSKKASNRLSALRYRTKT